jgi:ribonuclease E
VAEAAPPLAEEPRRRRVRRKTSASATTESALETAVEPNEIDSDAAPAELDVAARDTAETAPTPAPEPEPAPVVEAVEAPKPEVDVAALIAEDPNQIVAPPEKPKRGWWRR